MDRRNGEDRQMKLMRKGTKACRECRRRKIKCTYNAVSDTCVECQEHARTCVKQGYVRGATSNSLSSRTVRVKVTRLESAVQRLAREGNLASSESSAPFALQIHPKQSSSTTQLDVDVLDKHLRKHSPLFQLFNNDLFVETNAKDPSVFEASENLCHLDEGLSDKAKLLSTVSPHPGIYQVVEQAGDWWISWRDQHFALRRAAARLSLADFIYTNIADDDPVTVSIGLLALAMALCYLRPGIDDLSLNLSQNPVHIMNKITSAVDHVVLNRDTYKTNPNIVLLHTLRAKHHVENNQLRKSWLRIRQAIHAARSLGIGSGHVIENLAVASDAAEQQRFIGAIHEIDKFMSMILGFPYAVDEAFTDARAITILLDPASDHYLKVRAFKRAVAMAAARVNDKHANNDLSQASTDAIQSSLDIATNNMPLEWWQMISQPLCAMNVASQRHEELNSQIWFWNVQSFLYLPYLLQNSLDSPYVTYARRICLDSCRQLIRVFNFLRLEPSLSLYVCNCDDFQGLLASCMLVIGILQDSARTAENEADSNVFDEAQFDSDMVLIEEIKDIFRYRVYHRGSSISKQGLTLLEDLTSYLYEEEDSADGPESGKQRTILLPYFGTIDVQLVKKVSRIGHSTSKAVSQRPVQDQEIIKPSILPESDSMDHNVSTGSMFPAKTQPQTQIQAEALSATPYRYSNSFTADSTVLPAANQIGLSSQLDPVINWDQWDHLVFDNELAKDWNLDVYYGGTWT